MTQPGSQSDTAKGCLVVCLVPLVIIATALVVNGDGPVGVLWTRHHPHVHYGVTLAIQTAVASFASVLLAVAFAIAGSVVRWLASWIGLCEAGDVWRGFSLEGLALGAVLAGAYLGWTPGDVYENPDGPESVELRQASLIEEPLGLGEGSSCFTLVRVIWHDGSGQSAVQHSCEMECHNAVERITGRTVYWGKGDTSRAIVVLPGTVAHVFLPEPVEDRYYCTPEAAVEAYLRGEPVAEVERICRDDEQNRRADARRAAE